MTQQPTGFDPERGGEHPLGIFLPEIEPPLEAERRVGDARSVHDAIETFVGVDGGSREDVDRAVGDFVADPVAVGEGPALVGLEQILEYPKSAASTEHAMAALDPTLVVEAARDELATGVPPEQVEVALNSILPQAEYGEREAQRPDVVSSVALLLKFTAERPPGVVRLAKLEYQVPNPVGILEAVEMAPSPTIEQHRETSHLTLEWLRNRNMSLAAPVEAGSTGAEHFDQTQRDRRLFGPSRTGGAGRNESYCSLLFANASNPEIQEQVARSFEGKNVINLGGGNAQLGKELSEEHDIRGTHIVNIEPYPSDQALADPDSDPIVVANPAQTDFIEKSGLIPQSADEIIAAFSVPAYLGSPEEVTNLVGNIRNMLKPGGHARLSHLGFVGALDGDPRKDALLAGLQEAAEAGYLLETVEVNGTDTLIMTAPEG